MSTYTNLRQRGQAPNRQPVQKGSNVVRVKPSDPDVNADVLHQNMGFKRVGGAGNKVRRLLCSFSYKDLHFFLCVLAHRVLG